MYVLKRFHGERYQRLNAIIDSLEGHITSYVNLVGSATLPLPEICQMESLPGTAVRVEGHLQSRMFPSTDPIDEAEVVIEERTRFLFDLGEDYEVSGQPHSATQANHAVLRAVLEEGKPTVALLSTVDGGHISHRFGAPADADFVTAPLTPAGIDYDALEVLVRKTAPTLMIMGGTSYPLAFDFERLRAIADQVNCHLHADLAHIAPFVAAGSHPPAFPHVDSATLDTNKNLRGPSGGILIFRKSIGASIRRAIFPLLQSSPHPTGLMARAACLITWSKEDMESYANRMIKMARILAEGLRERLGDPVFGGTDSHLLLYDLSPLEISGRDAEERLDAARILVNRNQIPGDKKSPWVASGIRLGSTVPAILEYEEEDVEQLASMVGLILDGGEDREGVVNQLLSTYHRPLVSTASESTSVDPTRFPPSPAG
jgi:glycine hydroxymethyltransferase